MSNVKKSWRTVIKLTSSLGIAVLTMTFLAGPAKAAVPSQITTLIGIGDAGAVFLRWDAPSNGGYAISDYEIKQSTDGSTYTTISDGVSTATSYKVSGLTNGTTYYFTVAAKNFSGTATHSSAIQVIPNGPTDKFTTFNETCNNQDYWIVRSNISYAHQFNAGGSGTITTAKLRVGSQSYPTSVKISIYADNADTVGTLIGDLKHAETSGNITTYIGNIDIPAAGTYWFEVKPTAAIANHYYCGTSSTSATGSASGWTQNRTKIASGGAAGSFSSYFSGTSNYYPVIQFSSASSSQNVVTTAPAQVTGLTATASDAQIALSWTAPSNGGSAITDFLIEQSPNGTSSLTTVNDGTSTATSYTVTGLTNGTTYYYRVSAINSVGTGTASSSASATPTAATTAPAQVTGLTATAGDAQIALSWTAPSNGGSAITDFLIEQSPNGTSSWTTVNDGTSTATSYTVTGLTNGTTYYYRVSAVNSVGTGTASSSASATPTAPVIQTPTPTPTPSPTQSSEPAPTALFTTLSEPCTSATNWIVRSNVRYAHKFNAGRGAEINQAEFQLSSAQKYPSSVKVVIYSDNNGRLGSVLGELNYVSISSTFVSLYRGSAILPSAGAYWIELQPIRAIANHYYCTTRSTNATGSESGWTQNKSSVAYGSNSVSWSYFDGSRYFYPVFKLSTGNLEPTVTTIPRALPSSSPTPTTTSSPSSTSSPTPSSSASATATPSSSATATAAPLEAAVQDGKVVISSEQLVTALTQITDGAEIPEGAVLRVRIPGSNWVEVDPNNLSDLTLPATEDISALEFELVVDSKPIGSISVPLANSNSSNSIFFAMLLGASAFLIAVWALIVFRRRNI